MDLKTLYNSVGESKDKTLADSVGEFAGAFIGVILFVTVIICLVRLL